MRTKMNTIKGSELGPDYIELSQKITSNGTINACQSTNDEDCNGDAFLASTLGGQYLQTSVWAKVKSLEGWRPVRVVFIVVILPKACVYIYNPVFRLAYRNLMPLINARPALKNKILGRD